MTGRAEDELKVNWDNVRAYDEATEDNPYPVPALQRLDPPASTGRITLGSAQERKEGKSMNASNGGSTAWVPSHRHGRAVLVCRLP